MSAHIVAQSQWVWLARIRRPQGRKGEVLAEILTDFPEKFAERKQLWLLDAAGRSREVALVNHWLHKGCVVLHFEGIDSITAAEALNGQIVALPLAERAPLAEDEVYIGDLIGCELIDLTGPTLVGVIDDVDRTAGPVALLVVQSERGEVLVPFAKAWLRKIDLANKRVEMVLPEGLVEVNLT